MRGSLRTARAGGGGKVAGGGGGALVLDTAGRANLLRALLCTAHTLVPPTGWLHAVEIPLANSAVTPSPAKPNAYYRCCPLDRFRAVVLNAMFHRFLF